LLEKCVSHLFTAEYFFLHRELPNAPNAQTLFATKQLLPYSLDDIVVWITSLIFPIGPPDVAKGSSSEH